MKRYFVSYGGGESGSYFASKRAAVKAFNTEFENARGEKSMPETLERHTLSKDCFERCYNGSGGFVEHAETLKQRPQPTVKRYEN